MHAVRDKRYRILGIKIQIIWIISDTLRTNNRLWTIPCKCKKGMVTKIKKFCGPYTFRMSSPHELFGFYLLCRVSAILMVHALAMMAYEAVTAPFLALVAVKIRALEMEIATLQSNFPCFVSIFFSNTWTSESMLIFWWLSFEYMNILYIHINILNAYIMKSIYNMFMLKYVYVYVHKSIYT